MGLHPRWCPQEVGETAYLLGTFSESAEALAARVTSLHAAALLRATGHLFHSEATIEASLHQALGANRE